jgi:hypothetical protein
MIPEAVFALPIAYALADRFAGGGWPKLDDLLPGRGVAWAGVACAGLGWVAAGPFGALLALAWLIWRTPAWDVIPSASMTPKDGEGYLATFVRHALVAPLVLLAAYWTDKPLLAAAPFVAFGVAATILAAWYGAKEAAAIKAGRPIGDENATVELARGAAFGIAAVIACALF